MTLAHDHSFHIGEQHLKNGKPCQDYADSGMLSDSVAYAIVSDGCSSGGKTDIGSRLMVLATEQALREQFNPVVPRLNAIKDARDAYLRSWRDSLHLENKDLLATGLFIAADTNQCVVNIAGDGVLVIKTDGYIIAKKYEWRKNTPFYPAYNLIPEQKESFVALHEKAAGALTIETWSLDADTTELNNVETISVTEGVGEDSFIISEMNGLVDLAAVMSDGVLQVDGVDWKDVVQELVAFKSMSGQFAVRRMNRFLAQAKEAGRGPIDDIAYAVIQFPKQKP
jgi:hypothetical protein